MHVMEQRPKQVAMVKTEVGTLCHKGGSGDSIISESAYMVKLWKRATKTWNLTMPTRFLKWNGL